MDRDGARLQIASIARQIIRGETDVLVGCREIVRLRAVGGLQDDDVLLPILGIVSETDDLPDQSARHLFSRPFLERIEKEVAGYLDQNRADIFASCNEIIRKYSPKN